jgi:methylated-DNA-[protein]-cysteine S-methyltransferase
MTAHRASKAPARPRIAAFDSRVYAVLRQVPPGRVTTYGALARAVGCGSARAVGQALRRNPCAPEVPCHRVIRSDLRTGGFRGHTGGGPARRKKALLAAEGVRFRKGRLAEPARLLRELAPYSRQTAIDTWSSLSSSGSTPGGPANP